MRSHRLPSPLPDLLVELPKVPFQPVLGIDATILIKCHFLHVLSMFKDSLLHRVQVRPLGCKFSRVNLHEAAVTLCRFSSAMKRKITQHRAERLDDDDDDDDDDTISVLCPSLATPPLRSPGGARPLELVYTSRRCPGLTTLLPSPGLVSSHVLDTRLRIRWSSQNLTHGGLEVP